MKLFRSCPFGGDKGASPSAPPVQPLQARNPPASDSPALPVGKARVQLLYEEYIHLPQLRAVWDSPVTSEPVLEPCFAAALHGIELGFLLLAEFLGDGRSYVAKRPRIERVADDIAQQCKLLTEVVDGELEEEGSGVANRLSLTQDFPFPGAPPTSARPGHSPGLRRLEDAIHAALPGMTTPERNSLIKTVLNLSAAFASFQRWSVGLGLEPQLDALRSAVGLPPLPRPHAAWLDYDALVRPGVVEQTLTGETFLHAEDFFFRTVHLGTECWAEVALARLRSAAAHAADGEWHVAAARALQAARILQFLGDHVLLLTSMNLRDYLLLKVELEGTSGEGSVRVKALRPLVAALLDLLAAAALRRCPPSSDLLSKQAEDGEEEEKNGRAGDASARLGAALMAVYESPDRHRELYNFAKALEDVESALLGFFFKHYQLAANVIGSDAKGTMRRSVAALKPTYERAVFPVLDRVRSGLGAKVDAELAHVKGKMMQEILEAHLRKPSPSPPPTPTNTTPTNSPAPSRASSRQAGDAAGGEPSSGCPFGFGQRASPPPPQEQLKHAVGNDSDTALALRRLYGWESVPAAVRNQMEARMRHFGGRLGLKLPAKSDKSPAPAPLAFLDHAWGQVAPGVMHNAMLDLAALHQLGNPAWEELFGRVMPEAAAHVRALLDNPEGGGSDSGVAVHFGHNSHELVFRLLSERLLLLRPADGSGSDAAPLRVLASDQEFYSITRQLNRLAEVGAVHVHAVPAEPATTFVRRCAAEAAAADAAGLPFDVIYVSQVTYLTQQTLLPDVAAFVDAVAPAGGARLPSKTSPLVIVDGYHAFCAFPTSLAAVAQRCCYVGGLLKHAGCGANCAFITTPRHLAPRPACTGWLADPSVLGPGSEGIVPGSEVNYDADLALQGGTPGFMLPLLTFNCLMAAWASSSPPLTLPGVHAHVVRLQQRLLAGLPASSGKDSGVTLANLIQPAGAAVRSHTLVFRQPCSAAAKAVVDGLAAQGILVDCRKQFVRVGLGANHSAADVDALLAALTALT